ncbi:DUF596 domain-containing protein [Xylella taiwanensis]|uniref:DUF596 domain-containing protein n=1 Tax=Xylella taiwanensis TaxID=1444770 RepID=Z9JFY6_9GAMM|nr:DUF596 domain-containing protein [Xylella taiwanensis]EWS76938.1 hypothetical protein AF72_13515 [Xylella taiwanensis]MCD8456812.1 DUF596 domain-containing protein [Xylella taiwanensis]MCD8459222.1 DUF596 domain-containing protein [Xylella taiwanensis]MCD8462052.1 DUF596 domain-containing protein [Xylella taiwanensis]MCD8464310.1 DUF596 domain-containing protein [Xylella taiwanensis]
MLTQEQIDFICKDLGGGFHFLWSDIGNAYGIPAGEVDPDSFEERKNDFLLIIGKLLDEGRLKICNTKGEFIEGTTEELVEMFRTSFPASDEEVDLGAVGLWFVLINECPFLAVWVFKGEGENGEDYYEWT